MCSTYTLKMKQGQTIYLKSDYFKYPQKVGDYVTFHFADQLFYPIEHYRMLGKHLIIKVFKSKK